MRLPALLLALLASLPLFAADEKKPTEPVAARAADCPRGLASHAGYTPSGYLVPLGILPPAMGRYTSGLVPLRPPAAP